jgi:hypothetical protein
MDNLVSRQLVTGGLIVTIEKRKKKKMSIYNIHVSNSQDANIKFMGLSYTNAYNRALQIQRITRQPVVVTGGTTASILCAIPMNIGLCFAYSIGYIVSGEAI